MAGSIRQGCNLCPTSDRTRHRLTLPPSWEGQSARLQLRLRAKADSARRRRVHLLVFKGRGGLVAGVNPLSNKALLEALGDGA